MWFGIVSLFPEMFAAISQYGVTSKAIDNQLIHLDFFNPRDYTTDKHRTVDDQPYGGGPGMLMKVEPLSQAITSAKQQAPKQTRVIYLSPQGQPLTHQNVDKISHYPGAILIAGRYEGIDERVINEYVDESYSIGDYVVTGGELPAMVLIDAVSRLIPGVLGDMQSAVEDSFVNGLLDHPHYTRPQEILGKKVPKVLVNGNHNCILEWRLKQALGKTWRNRPDLLENKKLTVKEQVLLDDYIREHDNK